MDVRTALRQLRSELQMRQADLAAEIGISNVTLCRWETGTSTPGRAMALAVLSVASSRNASPACQAMLKDALMPSAKAPSIDDLRTARLDQINALVNDSSNGVIVSDASTHEILYVNQQMASITGKPIELAKEQKCHAFLFGKDHPCEFCQVCSFSEATYTTGEYESPKSGRCYVSRGKLIRWNDRKAHIEYITDMTDFHLTQGELAHHRELLSLACKQAQMWVFTLDVQKGDVYLDEVVQKALNLPSKVTDFIEKMLGSDATLARYAADLTQALAALRTGQEETELVVQTRIHASRPHWVRFRAKVVEKDRDGKPQTAICSAQMIDEEVAFRNRIRFEHEHILGSRKDLIGYVIANITKNTILESRGQIVDSDFPKIGAAYDASVQTAAERIEPPQERAMFLDRHARAALLAQFRVGELEQESDYQTLQPDGKLIWIHSKMKLVMQPAAGDVLLYEYSFARHTTKIMQGLLTTMLRSGYELLGAVSLLRDQVARLSVSSDCVIDEDALVFASYTAETKAYCGKQVMPDDRQAFLRAVSPETLRRELEHRSIYRVSYREIGADGEPHTKIVQYTLYDKTQQFCLLSMLDLATLTEAVANVDAISKGDQNA